MKTETVLFDRDNDFHRVTWNWTKRSFCEKRQVAAVAVSYTGQALKPVLEAGRARAH